MKVAAALSVLVTAFCLAFLFWSNPGGLVPPTSQPLKLRTESESAATPGRSFRKPDLLLPVLEPAHDSMRASAVLVPKSTSEEESPCSLKGCAIPARTQPTSDAEEQTNWGTAAGVKLPELRLPLGGREDLVPRTHTVVDGDTLTDLARRYLGDADRYLEIYQWNSDVLPNPDILPIGQLLRIPPRASLTQEPAQVIQRPVVPIAESQPEYPM